MAAIKADPALIHFANATELLSSGLGPEEEDCHGIGERLEEVNELPSLHAMQVDGGVREGAISLSGSMIFQNLVVTEVVGCIEHEKLVLKFATEAHNDSAVEDHVHLAEVLSTADNSLPRDIQPAVETGYEERDELITRVCALKREQVVEIMAELVKKFAN